MLQTPAILVGRLVRLLVRLVRPGGGSALPGLILSKLAPSLLSKVLGNFPDGLIVVTGSAGKSTTTKMLVAIARAHGKVVFTNRTTANIEQGFYASIIETSNVFGKIPGDVAILEMDEGHAATITKKINPRLTTILNVMEDQLDRFVDPALVRAKLGAVAANTKGPVLLNADDQNLLILASELRTANVSYFGIDAPIIDAAEHGLGTAPTYLPTIARPAVAAEVTSLNGNRVTARFGSATASFELPSRGLHFALDAVAAIESAKHYLGEKFNLETAAEVIDTLPPVFARGEVNEINGVPVEFILVQNPMSFQLNLDNLPGNQEQLMVAIGRDVHDPSWLWTVDYSSLPKVSVVSGYNAAEMALCLTYHDVVFDRIEPDLLEAVDAFFAQPAPNSGRRTVIFSADAMRRTRRHLGLTDPDMVDR